MGIRKVGKNMCKKRTPAPAARGVTVASPSYSQFAKNALQVKGVLKASDVLVFLVFIHSVFFKNKEPGVLFAEIFFFLGMQLYLYFWCMSKSCQSLRLEIVCYKDLFFTGMGRIKRFTESCPVLISAVLFATLRVIL